MKGLKDARTARFLRQPGSGGTVGNNKYEPSRRSNARWTGSAATTTATAEALQERLEELLVFELDKEGGRQYLQLSVRGLYRHVLTAITHRQKMDSEALRGMNDSQGHSSPTSFKQITSEPPPAAHALLHDESEGKAVNPTRLSNIPTEPSNPAEADTIVETFSQPAQRRVTFQSPPGNPNALPRPHPIMHRRQRSISVGSAPENNSNAAHPGVGRGPEQPVTYRERLGGYLHPRDMRRLVTPFSASNEPELIVRRHVMLLNFDPLRAIILRDRLLVLVPDGADSLLVELENRVRGSDSNYENSIFGDHGDKDEADTSEKAASYEDDAIHANATSIDGVHVAQEKIRKTQPQSFLNKLIKKSNKELNKLSSGGDVDADNMSRHSSSHGGTSRGHATPKDLPMDKDANDSDGDAETESVEESDGGDEWDEMEGKEWIDLPFELQCADACLYTVGQLLSDDTNELQDATLNYISRILDDGGLGDDPLTIIRAVKDAVREMTSRVKGFCQSLNRILDEDEDMALMNLSRLLTHPERFIQPVPQEVLEEESDEPELILEAHLQTALTLNNALDLIKGQIDTVSELVDQKLDSSRNKILLANMVISILSLCVTSAALVGSLFGMNLKNKYEESGSAFVKVTFGSLAGALGLGLFIMFVLMKTGTIPRTIFIMGEKRKSS